MRLHPISLWRWSPQFCPRLWYIVIHFVSSDFFVPNFNQLEVYAVWVHALSILDILYCILRAGVLVQFLAGLYQLGVAEFSRRWSMLWRLVGVKELRKSIDCKMRSGPWRVFWDNCDWTCESANWTVLFEIDVRHRCFRMGWWWGFSSWIQLNIQRTYCYTEGDGCHSATINAETCWYRQQKAGYEEEIRRASYFWPDSRAQCSIYGLQWWLRMHIGRQVKSRFTVNSITSSLIVAWSDWSFSQFAITGFWRKRSKIWRTASKPLRRTQRFKVQT